MTDHWRPPPRGFDRLSSHYRTLELLAFGRDLERARFCFLDQLHHARQILILGEGDGRCLERVIQTAPTARIRCVDASAGMLARAERRVRAVATTENVQFEHANVRDIRLSDHAYDAVLTFFFLDCFRAEDVTRLVDRVQRSLRPGGLWLFADFAMPAGPWRRVRARLWLACLYQFFRWQTGIDAEILPPSEHILANAGVQRLAVQSLQGGFIRSVLLRKIRSRR